MMKTIHGYHAHVYYDLASRESADALRGKLIETFGRQIRIHGLIDEPIGPHPFPMFEVDLRPEDFGTVVPWMMTHHGTHSILIHPLMGDEMAEHRDLPIWIGKQLTLDLKFLEDYLKR